MTIKNKNNISVFKKKYIFNEKIILIILSLSSLLISFFINLFGVTKIGFNHELDLYYIIYAISTFCVTTIMWPLSNAAIPILIKNELKISVIFYITLIYSFLSVALFYFILSIYAISSSIGDYRIPLLFSIFLFLDCVYVYTQIYLQNTNQYIKMNLYFLLGNIIQFIFVFFSIDLIGIYSLILGLIISKMVSFLLIIKELPMVITIKNKELYLISKKILPISISSLYSRSNEIVDRYLSSFLITGSISIVGFSTRISSAITTVINTSIVTPTITSFTKEKSRIKKELTTRVLYIFIIFISSISLWYIFGEKIITLMLNDNQPPYSSIYIYNICLFLLLLTIINPIVGLANNILLSRQKLNYVAYSEIIAYSIGILIKIILTIYLGLKGLIFAIIIEAILKLIVKSIYIIKSNQL